MRMIWTITAISFSLFCGVLYAQDMNPEKQIEMLNEQIEELLDFCDSVYGKDIRLVKGRVYLPPNLRAEGHPYFRDPEWMTGSVTVSGATFTGIKLNYDIYQDHLVFLDESKDGSMIRLLLSKNHTEAFTLEEHRFILLDPSNGINIPEKQYFEILFSGKASLIQRWAKQFEAVATQDYPYGRYTNAEITRYILKDAILYRFTNRFSLFKILADRKNELKKYLRKNRIFNVKKSTDQKIAGLIEYYNSIIP